jgi:hypothetical protein
MLNLMENLSLQLGKHVTENDSYRTIYAQFEHITKEWGKKHKHIF